MTRPTLLRPAAVLRAGAATALAAALLVGCGSSDSEDQAADPTSATAPDQDETSPAAPGSSTQPAEDPDADAAEPPVEVPDALQFEATTVAGDAFDGASVAGRPVVLWFWAPWCAVCKSQAPEVSSLADTYGDDVAFVGVGSLSDGDAIADFADDVPGPTHLSDPDGELYQRFGIAEQSSFVVLDADGQEVLRTGYADDDALADTVAELVG